MSAEEVTRADRYKNWFKNNKFTAPLIVIVPALVMVLAIRKEVSPSASNSSEPKITQLESPTRSYQPPSSEILRLTRVSLTRWRTQHPDISLEINVLNNATPNVPTVVKTFEDLLAMVGIPILSRGTTGVSVGPPAVFMLTAALPTKPAAADLREAIAHLVTGVVLDVSELPTNRIVLSFNAVPSFTGDGRVVFE